MERRRRLSSPPAHLVKRPFKWSTHKICGGHWVGVVAPDAQLASVLRAQHSLRLRCTATRVAARTERGAAQTARGARRRGKPAWSSRLNLVRQGQCGWRAGDERHRRCAHLGSAGDGASPNLGRLGDEEVGVARDLADVLVAAHHLGDARLRQLELEHLAVGVVARVALGGRVVVALAVAVALSVAIAIRLGVALHRRRRTLHAFAEVALLRFGSLLLPPFPIGIRECVPL
eukprot:6186587-Pleurochrysis_carterae.AAC.3